MGKTITYSEKNNGWTSFHSWMPEAISKINNRFFTVKNGQLYLHNDKDNSVRNNFYGVQYGSKVITVINENPSDDKIFKTLVLEGNRPWNAKVSSNYSNSTITADEFNLRESRFFSHIRKNEDETDLHGHSAQGIGAIVSSSGLGITFASVSPSLSIGDKLYQVNGANNELIGTITSITGNVINVDAITTTPVNGYFAFGKKPSRVEGSEIRGYYMEVELDNDDTEAVELFSISSNVVKSYL